MMKKEDQDKTVKNGRSKPQKEEEEKKKRVKIAKNKNRITLYYFSKQNSIQQYQQKVSLNIRLIRCTIIL